MKTMSAAGNEMNCDRNRGFSLLELLVVVLVLGLVLAVAYPSLSRATSTLHLRSAARDVLNSFRYARERAVAEQKTMVVTVDREKRTLRLSNDLGDGGRTYTLPNDVQIRRLTAGGDEAVENSLTIRFLPNGSAEKAEIALGVDAGRTLRVITDSISGGARIESGGGAREHEELR